MAGSWSFKETDGNFLITLYNLEKQQQPDCVATPQGRKIF